MDSIKQNKICQFEVWQVNLNPTKGSEQKGIRPCIVLQTNAVSDFGLTTIIAPLTGRKIDNIYPYEIKILPTEKNGLKETSKAKFDQVRVIDKTRLIKKIGSLEEKYYNSIINCLNIIFDLHGDFR